MNLQLFFHSIILALAVMLFIDAESTTMPNKHTSGLLVKPMDINTSTNHHHRNTIKHNHRINQIRREGRSKMPTKMLLFPQLRRLELKQHTRGS